jgi:hypothetical protein
MPVVFDPEGAEEPDGWTAGEVDQALRAYDALKRAYDALVKDCPDADDGTGWVEAATRAIVWENGAHVFAPGPDGRVPVGCKHEVKIRVRLPLPPAPPEVVAEVIDA